MGSLYVFYDDDTYVDLSFLLFCDNLMPSSSQIRNYNKIEYNFLFWTVCVIYQKIAFIFLLLLVSSCKFTHY